MEQIISMITELAAEIIVIVLGTLGAIVLNKLKGYLETLKKKDQLKIVDRLTDVAVEYVENNYKGEAGLVKRAEAIKQVVTILNDKGLPVSYNEIMNGVENGVNKLKEKQK